MPHKFVIAVLMEYIRSLNQFQIPVQVPSEGYLLSYIRGIRSGHRRSKKRWLFRVQNFGWFLTWQLFLLVLVENTVTAKLWPGREFELLQPQPANGGRLGNVFYLSCVPSITYMNLSSRPLSSTTSFTCSTSSCSTTCSATPSLWSVPLVFLFGSHYSLPVVAFQLKVVGTLFFRPACCCPSKAFILPPTSCHWTC